MIKLNNPHVVGHIEDQGDKIGRGSVFRACLAIQRSSDNEELGSNAFNLGYNYVSGIDTLKQLKALVTEYLPNASAEFEQALIALRNALEDAPSIKPKSKVDERKELWNRLNRRINNHQN
jgi:hypothetical protein